MERIIITGYYIIGLKREKLPINYDFSPRQTQMNLQNEDAKHTFPSIIWPETAISQRTSP